MRTCPLVACPLLFCVFIVLRAEETNKDQLHLEDANPNAQASGELRSHLNGIIRKRNNILQAYPCTSDRECGTGLYCSAPKHTPSHCSPCRRRGRRCYRDSMCCPGNQCHNYVCSKRSQQVPGVKNQPRTAKQQKPSKRLSKLRKAAAGVQCVRSADCAPAHCCARHLWTRVCKAEPREGEACSAPLQNKGGHRMELFQRCLCSSHLTCRPQTIHSHLHTHTHTRQPAAGLHTCQKL